MTFYYSTFSTSLGKFSLAVDAHGAVAATAFGDHVALGKRLFRHANAGELKPATKASRAKEPSDILVADDVRTQPARDEVRAYFRRERQDFSVPLRPRGTPFQKRVWAALRQIPLGETRSYGELARRLRSGARAVGRANATNPICLLVPCHRVIGANGSLTGFAFGEEVKRQLLAHEAHYRRATR